ncbi:MAG: hypothetical protein HYV07_18660 [Deltaproteobacteria bacterium]|nr:hypothetical protein [Deltaproteobacteria bacterium]
MSLPVSLAVFGFLGCGDNLTPPEAPVESARTCDPDLDGVIRFDELRLTLEAPGSFLVSSDPVEVDVEGTVDDRGVRIFDFSRIELQGASTIRAVSVLDRWYSGSFPPDAFVLEEPGRAVHAVYVQTSSALSTLGFASREEAPAAGKTLIVYDQPVTVHRYPLRRADRLEGVGVVTTGTLNGLPYSGRDTWSVEVAATGELQLPDVILVGAYRLDLEVASETNPSAGAPLIRRAASFLFECFGEVAHFEGSADDPNNRLGTITSSRVLTLRR